MCNSWRPARSSSMNFLPSNFKHQAAGRPNKWLQPTYLPPLRYGKSAAEPRR